VSHDGGQTTPLRLASALLFWQPMAHAPLLRSLLLIALTTAGCSGQDPHVLDHHPGALSWCCSLAVDGQTGLVAYGTEAGLQLARSRDGGRTFPGRAVVIDPAGIAPAGITVTGPRIDLAYQAKGDIRVARSLDGGDTFTVHSVARAADGASLLVDGDALLVAYVDLSQGSGTQVLFTRSSDGGATWSTPVMLPFVGTAPQRPSLVKMGDSLVVTFYQRDAHTQGTAHSSDGGVTWTSAPSQREFLVATGSLVATTDALYLPMIDGGEHLIVSASRDLGATWTEHPLEVAGGSFGRNGSSNLAEPSQDVGARLVARGSTLYAIFDQGEFGEAPRLGVARSLDGGASWPADHVATVFGAAAGSRLELMESAGLAIANDDSPLLLVAFDDGDAIRVMRSTDEGRTWP